MKIEARLQPSRKIAKNAFVQLCGRYQIQPIQGETGDRIELLLKFEPTALNEDDTAWHPQLETQTLGELLGLFLNSTVEVKELNIDGKRVPDWTGEAVPVRHVTDSDLSEVSLLLEKALRLDDDLGKQLVRASHAYHAALQHAHSDPTFSFFLLTVAIECLSSQESIIPSDELDREKKKCERFCRFFTNFVPMDLRGDDERDSDLFSELLKTIYYRHRSAFTHGGHEVSSAARLADQLGSSHFAHFVEGKRIRTPGLFWFANNVRFALFGFLTTFCQARNDGKTWIRSYLDSQTILFLEANRPIDKGAAVTTGDIRWR